MWDGFDFKIKLNMQVDEVDQLETCKACSITRHFIKIKLKEKPSP